MKWLAPVVLAILIAPATEQRPDGFGGRGLPSYWPASDRSPEALGDCELVGFAESADAIHFYEVWTCSPSAAVILWPIPCTEHPTQPCKET